MAKFKVVSGFSLGQHVDVYAGDVIQLPDNIARHFVQRGRVVAVDEVVEEPTAEKAGRKGKV